MPNLAKYEDATWAATAGVDSYGDRFVKMFRTDIDSPDPDYPFYAGFTAPCKFPEADGLPADAGQEYYVSIQETLLRILEEGDEGRLAYMITSNNHKTFLFYTRSKLEQLWDEIAEAFSGEHPVVIEVDEDPSWGLLMEQKAFYDQQQSPSAGKGLFNRIGTAFRRLKPKP